MHPLNSQMKVRQQPGCLDLVTEERMERAHESDRGDELQCGMRYCGCNFCFSGRGSVILENICLVIGLVSLR